VATWQVKFSALVLCRLPLSMAISADPIRLCSADYYIKRKKAKAFQQALRNWPWLLGGVHWRLKVIEIHSASAGSMSIRFPTAHVDAYLIECQRGREIIDGCRVYFRFSLWETSERNTHICTYMRKRSIRVWFSSTSVMDMCLFEYKAYACLICLLFCSLR